MKDFALPYSRFSYPMKLAARENFLTSDHSLGVCQALYERGGNAPCYRQHFDKGRLSNHRRVGLHSRCRVSAGSKTFTVTFLEDFGVLCGREMRCLMTTAK